MDAYALHDGRLIQEMSNVSAANALTIGMVDVVPPGQIWTVLSAGYQPSVLETQIVLFEIVGRSGDFYPINVPTNIQLQPDIRYPFLTEGMEIKLWPGELLRVRRAAATAGSTMAMWWRYIETDLPLYEYIEPQERKRQDQIRSSVLRQMGGGGGARAGTRPTRMGPSAGSRTRRG